MRQCDGSMRQIVPNGHGHLQDSTNKKRIFSSWCRIRQMVQHSNDPITEISLVLLHLFTHYNTKYTNIRLLWCLWCANHCIMAILLSLRLNSNHVIGKWIINVSTRRLRNVKSITVVARQGESFLQAQRKIRLEPCSVLLSPIAKNKLLTFAIK